MGFIISTIDNLPSLSGYYFFLSGNREFVRGMSGPALYNRFEEVATRLGKESALIRTNEQRVISEELFRLLPSSLRRNASSFLQRYYGIVIMKPHPHMFRSVKNGVFVVVAFDALDEIYATEDELINDILELSIRGKTDILEKLRKNKPSSKIPARIWRALILRPTIYGIGIDIKELFKKDKPSPRQVFFSTISKP